MAQLVLHERAKGLARESTQFSKFWETLVAEKSPPPELTKERFREMVLNFDEHFITQIDPKYATFSILQHATAIYDELKQFYWCICRAPSGWPFITSDSPVVVRFRKGDGVAFGGGFGHPTAQVIFPISPTVCLYLSRTFREKAALVNSVFVKMQTAE